MKERIRKILSNKNLMKKIAIAVLVIIIAVGLGIAFYNKVFKKKVIGETPQVSEKLIEEKKYGDLKFDDIEVTTTDELNHVELNITNTGKEKFAQEMVNINFLDENRKVIQNVEVIIPDIEANNQARVDMIVDSKVVNAYTFTIEKTSENKG